MSSSSIVEQLQLLRSFVGGSYSETDLSTCLRQANYNLQLAAERLMTGEYQPLNKKQKGSSPTNTYFKSNITTSTTTRSYSTTTTSTTTRIRKPTPVTPRTPKSTLSPTSLKSSLSSSTTSSSSPKTNSPKNDEMPIPDKNTWLLCHRWISDGINLQRNGCLAYQERLTVEHRPPGKSTNNNNNNNASASLLFRGRRIQGQFPKHLTAFLGPLLQANLVLVQAQALMEERYLPTGAHIAFAVWIYLVNPNEFFALFDKRQPQLGGSASKEFFGTTKTKAGGKMDALCEAAFGLLQWAQYGETFEFNTTDNDSSDEEDATTLLDDDNDATVDEDKVPEWAAKLQQEQPSTALQEMEAPQEFKVTLRPYQRQALWWMTQRESQQELEESSRQQLQLLQELVQASQGKTNVSSANIGPNNPIRCDCGPVQVNLETIQAPAVQDNGASPDLQHPLWERRYLTNQASPQQVRSFYVQPLFGAATGAPPPPPQPCRGGILADSMGLGKTVMLLALIQSTASSKRGPTLIVSPLSLLAQWQEELESKTTLTYRVHYGDRKQQQGLANYQSVDVVLTTYGSLQGEWVSHTKQQQQLSDQPTGPLLRQSWLRVILDEAHCIKNTSTVASRVCCLLQAERRWCVSGTIIQNSLDDVYALLKFLHHEPWCQSSFWKAAITKASDPQQALDRVRRLLSPIMLRRTKSTIGSDGKPILTLPPVETKIIPVDFTPAERQFYDALHRKSLSLFEGFIEAGTASKSWLAIFSLLHRLRQTCDHVALTIKAHMDQDEWTSSISQTNNKAIQEPSSNENTSGDKSAIDQKFLDGLMRQFRTMQASNQKGKPNPQKGDGPYLAKIANMLNEAVQNKSSLLKEECSICLDPINIHNSVVTPCFHIFCKDCLVDVLRQQGASDKKPGPFTKGGRESPILRLPAGPCPVCTETMDPSKILRLSESDGHIQTNYLISSLQSPEVIAVKEEDGAARQALEVAVQGSASSKLNAIVQELDAVWEEDPGSKVLIFSQFLGFLDLIEESFKSNKIPFSRLDGKLSLKERMAVLQEFGQERPAAPTVPGSTTDKKGSVLLISMKAGGVGLNLVAARTLFITDPWWNAAVEDQCVDRIHRIGQTAEKVRVRKFYVTNSVEERIVELQKRKKDVATKVLCDQSADGGEASGGNARPTLDDFRILFRQT